MSVEQDERWSLARSLLKERKPCFRDTIESLLDGYKTYPGDAMSLDEFADACYDAATKQGKGGDL